MSSTLAVSNPNLLYVFPGLNQIKDALTRAKPDTANFNPLEIHSIAWQFKNRGGVSNESIARGIRDALMPAAETRDTTWITTALRGIAQTITPEEARAKAAAARESANQKALFDNIVNFVKSPH